MIPIPAIAMIPMNMPTIIMGHRFGGDWLGCWRTTLSSVVGWPQAGQFTAWPRYSASNSNDCPQCWQEHFAVIISLPALPCRHIKRRDLLTLRNRHGNASTGTLSDTPVWACLQVPSCGEISRFVADSSRSYANLVLRCFLVVILFDAGD